MSHDEPLNRLQVFQTPSKICAGNVDCQHLSTTSVCRKIIFPRLFLGIETPENFETETAPSFLDSLHLEEAGRWSAAAHELLMQNGIEAGRLGQAIFNALKFGRASCLLCKQVYCPSVLFHLFDELKETPCWDLCCTRGL